MYKQYKTDLKRFIETIAKNQKQCDRYAAKGDLETAQYYEEDIKDMTEILNELQNGDFEYAFDLMYELDSAVKDQIPTRLYNHLAKINGYN